MCISMYASVKVFEPVGMVPSRASPGKEEKKKTAPPSRSARGANFDTASGLFEGGRILMVTTTVDATGSQEAPPC